MDRSLYLEIHRQFNIERQGMPVGGRIVFDELSIMALLQLKGSLSVKEIAAEQLVCSSTTSRRVARLAQAGLVTAFRLPQDRRSSHCKLTPAGSRAVDACCQAFLDNLVPGSTLDLMGLGGRDVARLVSRMGRVPMPADNLILYCYGVRGSEAMQVRDMVALTGLLQATVSMTLRRMERDGTMQPVYELRCGSERPYWRHGMRRITPYGTRCAAELLRLVDEV